MIRQWSLPSRLAFLTLVLATALAVAAAVGAWRLEPLPRGAAPDLIELNASQAGPGDDASSMSIVLSAVSRDPFRPDRRRPASRYLLPGERTSAPARANRLPPGLARMRLLGTALVPGGGGLAALEIPGRASKVVRLGEEFEGLRLVSIERGIAVFETPDTTLTLSLPGTIKEQQKP
jgi:hypothetical protein